MGAVVSLSFTSRMNMHGACICMAVAQMHKKSMKPFTKDDLGIERYGKKKVAYYSRRAPFISANARSATDRFF